MFTGRKYRLGNPTLALDFIDDKRVAVTIPAGSVIEVMSGPHHDNDDALLRVRWQDKTVSMFAIDIEMRGTLLPGENAAT